MSPNRCSSFRLRPGSHLASAQSKRRLLAHNVRPVSSVDAADDGRCLQYSAIARGSAFSQTFNSVLGRRPRAHSSTGEACATFARRRMAVWVRRVRRRPLPVSKWRLVRTHIDKPQPPEFARRAHAIARPWPYRCRFRPSGPGWYGSLCSHVGGLESNPHRCAVPVASRDRRRTSEVTGKS